MQYPSQISIKQQSHNYSSKNHNNIINHFLIPYSSQFPYSNMSILCPSEGCGRILQNEIVLAQHFKRRHPNEKLNIQNTHKTNDTSHKKSDHNLLPKISLKRSISKDNKEKDKEDLSKTQTKMEVNQIIAATRNTVKIGQIKKLKLSTTATLSQTSATKIIQPSRLNTPTIQEKKIQQIKDVDRLTLQNNQKEKPLLVKKRLSLKKDKDPIQKYNIQASEQLKHASSLVATSIPLSEQKTKISLRPKSRQRRPSQITKQKVNFMEQQRVSTADQKSHFSKPAVIQKTKTTLMQPTNTLIIKVPTKVFVPSFFTIQVLYLNNIGLQSLTLQGLQFLYELSAEGNNLCDMNFLNYSDNANLGIIHLSSNKIKSLVIPENVETITMAFNQIEDLKGLTTSLRGNSSLKALDLSQNPVTQLCNFKFQVLLSAKNLIKLNTLKITNADIDASLEYKTILDRKPQNKTVANSYYDRFNSKQKFNMTSTTGFQSLNTFRQEDNSKLEKELKDINSKVKQVKTGLSIIECENAAIRKEIQQLRVNESQEQDLDLVYKQLQMQMQILELMNFLKVSSKQELGDMIKNMGMKMMEIGCN